MRVTFLGTGAATACPLVFCRCPVCRAGWERGGKDLRRRSSALIGEDTLIDLGPDIMSAAFAFGVDIGQVRYCLQTHAHSDHFDAGHLITRLPEYAVRDLLPLTICASPQTIERMSSRLALEEEGATLLDKAWQRRLSLTVRPMEHGDTEVLGARRVTAVESAHDISGGSLLWVVEEKGSAFLYATDTVRLTDRALSLFHDRGLTFDAVAIDHTYGPGTPGGGHLCADEVTEEISRLREAGCLAPHCRLLATHLSHEGMLPHREMSQYARSKGYGITWDGMRIEI